MYRNQLKWGIPLNSWVVDTVQTIFFRAQCAAQICGANDLHDGGFIVFPKQTLLPSFKGEQEKQLLAVDKLKGCQAELERCHRDAEERVCRQPLTSNYPSLARLPLTSRARQPTFY